MKKNFLPTACVLLILFFLVFSACTKQGVLGPQGVPGKQGEQGQTGPQGEQGALILAGSGAPVADSGRTGDFYIDTTGLLLYGPKEETGWGTGISLRGTDKTSLFHGNGKPAASLGNEGDFYFDDLSGILYGPKTDGDWGSGFLLHGAQGPEGPQGPQGNANVQAYTFHSGLAWDSFGHGVYQITKHTDAIDSINLAQGALLAYVQLSDSFWYQAPFWFNGRNYYYNISKGVFTIYTPDPGTVIYPEEVTEIKLIVMQGTALHADGVQSRLSFGDFLRAARAVHGSPQ